MNARAMLCVLALAAALTACEKTFAADAPSAREEGSHFARTLGPGDTLRYTLSTAPVPGATGYKWTVTSVPNSFTGLPTNLATGAPSVSFTAVATAPWDSVSFSGCVTPTATTRSAKSAACTVFKLSRYLAAALPPSVDSSALGPISLLVRPKGPVTIQVGATQQFCAFWRFGSGHVAERTIDQTSCAATYQSSFTPAQLAVSAAEQSWMDATCEWPACLLGALRIPARERPDMVLVRRA